MNFGFFPDQDGTRYCYLRLRRLKAAIKDPTVLDALLTELEVSGQNLSASSPGKKLAAIERRIDELRRTQTSIWYDAPAPDVLAASIFKARTRIEETVQNVFTSSREAAAVVAPVHTWLKGSGLTIIEDVPVGTGHVDLVGYRTGLLSGPRVVAIQVKNELKDLDRALEDMKALAPYTSATYLACTPALAAESLLVHAARRRWDGEILRRRLQASGSGLLLVERDAVAQGLLPKERVLDVKKLQDILATMGGR